MRTSSLLFVFVLSAALTLAAEVPPFAPTWDELKMPFSAQDEKVFAQPPTLYRPETLFFFMGGNVSKEGITADLEAIAAAGISGIQLFHGQMGGPWEGVSEQIACLSPKWNDVIKHTGEECKRLGLKLALHNSPGWAMSGGPWIKPENAMRHIVASRTDIEGGKTVNVKLPAGGNDYRSITVIAFPTPKENTGKPLAVKNVTGNGQWQTLVKEGKKFSLRPSAEGKPHTFEVEFDKPVVLRTVELPPVDRLSHAWSYEPGINIEVVAVLPDGKSVTVLKTPLLQASWQDDRPISLSCDETEKTAVYRVSIANKHQNNINFINFYTDAKKNNWESEAGFTLRSIVRSSEHPKQSPETFVKTDNVLDISKLMDNDGNLNWDAPAGQWTVLRIGHVFTGMYNGPSPPEGRGPECDKLNVKGADAHFAGYIGKLADGTLSGGLMKGMHLDSWECKTQTWTDGMAEQFAGRTKYPLQKYLPALFGFVTDNQETTSQFLCDWRRTINDLLVNEYYGQMAKLAHEKGLGVTYETASGDIFPADIMEYYKSCDVPQTEFWQPIGGYVGSINFKPVRPAASAMRLYGKTRLGAEAFTSFALTWDEHLPMLKEVASYNCVQGVTHLLFHTYTHNPLVNQLPPGSSFGFASVGTPFLRGQTWWKYMPEFTAYLGRCNYLWERGKPVSDVLWYLGDEIDHKPDQNAPFPDGYKYDYCNPDVLLHRLAVKDGQIVTPEGIRYRILWIPENERMLPETLEKLIEFANQGAVIVANPPQSLATLSGGEAAQERFDKAVKELWGKKNVLANTSIGGALKQCGIEPDLTGGDVLWLHRQTDGADWYYVAAPVGSGFKGTIHFRNNKQAECWNPVTGEITPLASDTANSRRSINFDLAQSESCFVVFRNKNGTPKEAEAITAAPLNKQISLTSWQLSFPAGWGIDSALTLPELKPWKDLDVSPEGKAFSGTAAYSAVFDVDASSSKVTLDLGKVEMIAAVYINGQKVRTLWCPPFRLDITQYIKPGKNELKAEVTSSWFNRLVYDAGQPKEKRKTWLITGPKKESPLRDSGLLGPVVISSSAQTAE